MKLIALRIQNFRQHRDTQINFFDGIMGIVGKNGSGKTTILEAIAWTLYGQKAVQRMDRGKADTIKPRGAGSKDHTECALDFELAGQHYRVVRRLNDASLLVGEQKLHTGTDNVTKAVTQLLRMDPQAFFTSFFTGQKDLAFLRDVNSRGREEYIGKLLGYSRLSRARDMANEEKLAIGRDISMLVQGLGDPDEIKNRKREAKEQLKSAQAELEAREKDLKNAEQQLAKIEPEKTRTEETQKSFEKLTREAEIKRNRLNTAQTELINCQTELKSIEENERELASLKPLLDEYEKLKERNEELVNLREADQQRQNIQQQIDNLTKEIGEIKESLTEYEKKFTKSADFQEAVNSSEKLRDDLQKQKEQIRNQNLRESAEIEAALKTKRLRVKETEDHLKMIMDAGPDGTCPTCERPLGDEFERVTSQMRNEAVGLRNEIEKLETRQKSLQQQPESIADLEKQIQQVEAELEKQENSLYEARVAGEHLERERNRLTSRQSDLTTQQEKLAVLPSGYDAKEFEELRKRGQELRPKRDRAIQLEGMVIRKDSVLTKVRETSQTVAALQSEIEALDSEIGNLGFSEEKHLETITKWQVASTDVQQAREQFSVARVELQAKQQRLSDAELEEQKYNERAKALQEKREEQRHLEFLTTQFDELRRQLNNEIRPRLSEAASTLIAEITEGRYAEVDLDEDYTPRLFDDGEYKPIISGGEEDILHLSLRLAVSQMIAERAGIDLGLLVLDEVFGSLDDTRRENVITLLQNLKGAFNQILLITHIESIHDMVDRCIWVEYDQPQLSSRVREARDDLNEEFLLSESELEPVPTG